jgi:glycogen(starch) synthase
MKVLLTADTVGGVFTYTADLAEGLVGSGADVQIATFGAPLSRAQRERLHAAGAHIAWETSLALEWMPNPWCDLRVAEKRLLELAHAYSPDVVHLNAFGHGNADWPAPALVVGHSCVCSWWEAVHGQAPPPQWRRYRELVRAGLTGAGAVAAPSRAMAGALQRWYGPLPAPVITIPNGTAYAGARTPPRKRAVVLCAGRLWDAGKNVAALERAASRAPLRGRVLLAGAHGESAQSAEGGARRLGPLAPQALAEVRRTAAVYAAPARYEPFGLGILEAARDWCALVLGDIDSLREVWADAAVYVAPGDDERLARTLAALLEDPARAAQLGARARARSLRFTQAAMVHAHLSLYRRLVHTHQEVAA